MYFLTPCFISLRFICDDWCKTLPHKWQLTKTAILIWKQYVFLDFKFNVTHKIIMNAINSATFEIHFLNIEKLFVLQNVCGPRHRFSRGSAISKMIVDYCPFLSFIWFLGITCSNASFEAFYYLLQLKLQYIIIFQNQNRTRI